MSISTAQRQQAQAVSGDERLRIVAVWIATRALVLGAAAAGSWSALQRDGGIGEYVQIWKQWDTHWFDSIAVYGYIGPHVSDFQDFRFNIAFFPGLPSIMRAGLWAGIPPTVTGLVVSFIAGLVAAFAVAQLTRQVGGRGEWGVVAFAVAPTALFLTAAYTEALFAAFAFWAWVHARRGSWVVAGALAGGAALVRSNGLFLAVGLVVMFLGTRPWRAPDPARQWTRGIALLIPVAVTLGYFAYLRVITGSWTAWSEAQAHWDRSLVDPVTSLVNTYQLIFTFSPTGEPSSRMVTEILAMVIILGVSAITLARRWWAESAYLLVTAAALGTSTMYHSVPRAIVVLFPIWMLLGVALTRRRWLRWAYIAVCLPVLIWVTVRFTQGQWIS